MVAHINAVDHTITEGNVGIGCHFVLLFSLF